MTVLQQQQPEQPEQPAAPKKRPRVTFSSATAAAPAAPLAAAAAAPVAPHPYGVRPWGNYLADRVRRPVALCREPGLGALHALDDALLLRVLGGLGARELCALAAVSRAVYVFVHHDELWRALALQTLGQSGAPLRFERSWKRTLCARLAPSARAPGGQPIQVHGFYSDLLFQPWFCTATGVDPRWLGADTIPRRSASELSGADFVREFEEPNRPVIISGVVETWEAYRRWGREDLRTAHGDVVFNAGGYGMRLADYFDYSAATAMSPSLVAAEETPLYLFDQEFVNKVPALGAEYQVPSYFAEDLFGLLGAEKRPAYRWLIVGPQRGGSTFHVDPNATSAWNAVIRGSKKWILFPPRVPPPGVYPTPDGSTVATSVSIIEWFLNFYQDAHKLARAVGGMEGVCREGELIFVPSGWWHCAINLEESIAITQNYVSSANLPAVCRFLRTKHDQVSGLEQQQDALGEAACETEAKLSLYDRFIAALRERRPELLPRALEEAETMEAELQRRRGLGGGGTSTWERLTTQRAPSASASSSSARPACAAEPNAAAVASGCVAATDTDHGSDAGTDDAAGSAGSSSFTFSFN